VDSTWIGAFPRPCERERERERERIFAVVRLRAIGLCGARMEGEIIRRCSASVDPHRWNLSGTPCGQEVGCDLKM
jgi:hypothetical protein